MDRVAHKSHGHDDAAAWDRKQQVEMTPDERRAVAKALRDRVYGKNRPDIRDVWAGAKRKRASGT